MDKKNKKTLTFVPLESAALGRFLFFTCFISYVLLYFGRSNFSAVLPSLVDPVTGFFTKDEAGLINSAFFIVYAVGQLLNGFITEKLPPFGLIGTSLTLGTFANLAMYLATTLTTPNLYLLITVWAINGYVQSFVFTSYMRIFAMILPEKQRNAASTNIFIGTALGPVIALLISQQILRVSDNWQLLFLAGSIAIGAASVFWFAATRKIAKLSYKYTEISDTVSEDTNSTKISKIAPRESKGLVFLLIASGVLLITLPSFIFAFAKEGLQTWAPTFIKEMFGTSNSFAVAVSTVIPLFGISGSFIGRFIYEKLTNCELKTSSILFAVATAALFCTVAFTMNSLWGTIVLVTIAYTLLMSVNTMIIGMIPLRFARHGRTATVTGIFNSVGSLGIALSNYFIGLLAEHFDWRVTFIVLGALTASACVICLATVRRWTKFKQL